MVANHWKASCAMDNLQLSRMKTMIHVQEVMHSDHHQTAETTVEQRQSELWLVVAMQSAGISTVFSSKCQDDEIGTNVITKSGSVVSSSMQHIT
jgi:hypothetical protein